MPPKFFPLRWESTGDQWWFASPIDWAAANGHYELVRELLHLDTNLLIKLTSLRRIRRLETVWDDEEQFYDVAKCRALVARQLLAECEINKGLNSLIRAVYGGWLLYTAASAGDVEFVKSLLERDPLLVFGEGEYGVTDIFYAAARSKNSEVFRLLLDCSLEGQEKETLSDFRWDTMNRAVHAAARGGCVEFLRELLGDCSDVLVYRDAQGSTILHTASGRGQTEVIKDLLASYDIINSIDNQGNTALHVAAYRGHLAAVEILISSAPSLAFLTNNYGDIFLHMVVAGFRTPGFQRLDLQRKLMKQILSGEIVNLQEIINVRNNDGRTVLHTAMTENIQTDLVQLLMTAPSINLNIKDADGNTPLDLLKQQPRTASSKILIKQIISAGGISDCKDHVVRSALVSHLKMEGIGGSPGTSFRIPDVEIFLYTGLDNASDGGHDFTSTECSSCSGQLSGSESGAAATNSWGDRKLHSPNKAARGRKMLLHWPRRKGRKAYADNISMESYDICSKLENNPIPLRQRFSSVSSLANNKRLSVRATLPSPSSNKKFAAGIMHGVVQLMPRSSFESPSSPFSKSSWPCPTPLNREKDVDFEKVCVMPSS